LFAVGASTVNVNPHPDLPPCRGKGPALLLALLLLSFLTIQLFSATAFAAPPFPALTGRVVDEAGILAPGFETEIGAQLAAHEQATTNQVVIVTLKSLDGYDISDYANRLFRHWGIGQKDKNNGVLLVIAPNERKMRIEVGYGLEGVLTDAISHDIIERVLKPPFRQGNYEQGIRAGATAILAALGGEYRPAPPPPTAAGDDEGLLGLLIGALFTGQFLFGALVRRFSTGTRLATAAGTGAVAGIVAWFMVGLVIVAVVIGVVMFLFTLLAASRFGTGGSGGGSWGSSGGGWSGGGGGGGFSGGGGSSGGGGASGGW